MAPSPQSILVVGSGITGLCLAVVAQSRGHNVTLIARDAPETTASGIAAGMIAPALEALTELDPETTFCRLKAAQGAWLDLAEVWPVVLRDALVAAQDVKSLYVWPQSDNSSDLTTPRLHAMGVAFEALSDDELAQVAADCDGVSLRGDWLLDAGKTLAALDQQFVSLGGKRMTAAATSIDSASVTVEGETVLRGDAVVVAAGYGAKAFAAEVPSLAVLTPIKGHILDCVGQGRQGVIRSPYGYLAHYGDVTKFGASMQFGRDDAVVEPDVVADLKARAQQMTPDFDLSEAAAKVAVRASTPDGWPLIGRDAASGVFVATGMRRNGYVFAAFAARMIVGEIEGGEGQKDYDPNRFLKPR